MSLRQVTESARSRLHVVKNSETTVWDVDSRIVYGGRERPPVEVRVDGTWYGGRLCNQVERADGWWLCVLHHRPGSRTPGLANFAARDVRLVTGAPAQVVPAR